MTASSTSTTRYTTFYLVMLIITSLSVSFGLVSVLLGIPDFSRTMTFAPAYTICQIISSVVTLLAIPVLVLLWLKKNPLGIRLLLGIYAVLILTNIAIFFFFEPIVQETIALTVQDSPDLPAADVAAISKALLYGANIVIIIFNVILAVLWWFAYRNQQRADADAMETSVKEIPASE